MWPRWGECGPDLLEDIIEAEDGTGDLSLEELDQLTRRYGLIVL